MFMGLLKKDIPSSIWKNDKKQFVMIIKYNRKNKEK